jgi:PmbA protein
MEPSEILKMLKDEGFDEAVASISSNRSIYIKIANSKVDSIVEKKNERGRLFVSKEKKVAFSNIERPDKQSIKLAIGNVKQAINIAEPKPDYYGIAEGPFKYRSNFIFDKKISEISIEEASEIANQVISEFEVENIAGTLHLSSYTYSIATTKRVEASTMGTEAKLSLRIFKKGFSIQDSIASRQLKEIDISKIKNSISMLEYANGTGRVKSGKYDILYMRSPAGLLFSNVNDMACIDSVEMGSFLSNKLGSEIANKGLSIYDDGSIESGIDSSPFDEEGYPTQRTPIIKNGILKSYLHNYSTAKKYNTKSTGNAGLVNPSPNTMVLYHRKKRGLEKLISSIDKGIIVTNTWYTRFSNYLKGDFSTVPRDLAIYVEKGSPKFVIKNLGSSIGIGIRVSDNMLRMLEKTTAVADDIAQSTSWDSDSYYYTPSVLVEEVNVSTV